jgi:regulatory protein
VAAARERLRQLTGVQLEADPPPAPALREPAGGTGSRRGGSRAGSAAETGEADTGAAPARSRARRDGARTDDAAGHDPVAGPRGRSRRRDARAEDAGAGDPVAEPRSRSRRGAAPAEDAAPADPVAAARAVCLRLLTGQPRTRRQLADALRKRGLPEWAGEEVLSRFEDVGLIDDAAFAAAWVESRHRGRGLARRALERELRTRGVEGSLAAEAVAGLDPEREEETARDLVVRKARATRGLAREARIRRLVGMLARRGYPEGLAFRIVREVLSTEGEDAESLDPYLPDA